MNISLGDRHWLTRRTEASLFASAKIRTRTDFEECVWREMLNCHQGSKKKTVRQLRNGKDRLSRAIEVDLRAQTDTGVQWRKHFRITMQPLKKVKPKMPVESNSGNLQQC